LPTRHNKPNFSSSASKHNVLGDSLYIYIYIYIYKYEVYIYIVGIYIVRYTIPSTPVEYGQLGKLEE
jgi:hypothetical protein